MSGPATALKGLRVLVVEDEALVAMNLEMTLEDFGCQIIGPAYRFEAAANMAATVENADAAILDVNLSGIPAFGIAEILAARDIPFLFATGYGKEGIPGQWHDRPILQKPYTAEEVGEALAGLVAKVEQD